MHTLTEVGAEEGRGEGALLGIDEGLWENHNEINYIFEI